MSRTTLYSYLRTYPGLSVGTCNHPRLEPLCLETLYRSIHLTIRGMDGSVNGRELGSTILVIGYLPGLRLRKEAYGQTK